MKIRSLIALSILSLSTHAFTEESGSRLYYRCEVNIEDMSDAVDSPRYQPTEIQAQGQSIDLRTAIIKAFTNSRTNLCDEAINLSESPQEAGHWSTFDRDEKFLIASCSYSCELDSI